MNIREDKVLSLTAAVDVAMPLTDLKELFAEVLEAGMHGICFSAYEEGQAPGAPLSEEQIRRRLEILRPHSNWVRSFSCTEGNEIIPRIAKEMGMKTLVGAWLSEDAHKNREEVEALVQLANEGFVDIAAVGNEVLYREELSEDELLAYIVSVQDQIPNIPVGYVDAYYEFENRPRLTEQCQVILANCYPFWEGCHSDYSFLYMQDMYRRAAQAAKGKKVIISECGWPNNGQSFHGAEPSEENAIKYFINSQLWSKKEGIEMFYFSSFDEPWKVGDEGDVGSYWGLWDKNESLKY